MKRILLIDLDDPRRHTRVKILQAAGYEVDVRKDQDVAELLNHEIQFDLVLLALHRQKLQAAAQYSDRLNRKYVGLPILLLTDVGVFAPRGTLSKAIETGYPEELLSQLAEMLAGSKHIREIDADAQTA